MIIIGMINLSLYEIYRLKNVRHFVETYIKHSNIQNNVIHDEIIRKEKENSYNLQVHIISVRLIDVEYSVMLNEE
jgi:hypothetical protein